MQNIRHAGGTDTPDTLKRLIPQFRWPLSIGRGVREPVTPTAEPDRTRHDRALLYLSRRALRGNRGASLLGDICRVTARALRVDHVHVVELLPNERTVIARAASGWPPERLALWQFDLPPDSRLGQMMRHRSLLVLDQTAGGEDAALAHFLADLRMQSGVATGISAGADAYAFFGVYTQERRRFSREELQFVRGVGHLVESMLEHDTRKRTQQSARASSQSEQAELLRMVVERVRPALREGAGYLSQFRTHPADSFTFRRAVRSSERQVTELTDFIEDLRLLANLLEGWRPKADAVALAPVLASIFEPLETRGADRSIRLELRMADDLLSTSGDARLLRRALFMLVDSALRASGPGDTVRIRAAALDAGVLQIDIVDAGADGDTKDTALQTAARQVSEHRLDGLRWRLAVAIVEAHSGTLTGLVDGAGQRFTARISLPQQSQPGSGSL